VRTVVQKRLQLERELAQDATDLFAGNNSGLTHLTLKAAATGQQAVAEGDAARRRDRHRRV
jgi:hypothetical protein